MPPACTVGPTPEDAVRDAVRRAARVGAAVALHPGFDEAAMGAIWIRMVTSIAVRSSAPTSPATVAKLVASALTACVAYTTGSKILGWSLLVVLHAVPFAALPAAVALNGAVNALLTYRLGTECVRRFANPRVDAHDVIAIGRAIVLVPSFGELGAVRRMLAGG